MKLKIVDEFWAVGRRTKKVKTVRAPLAVGKIEGLGSGGSYWNIDEIGDDFVKISYIRHDGEVINNWTVTKGNGEFYRPRSMDAGHQYTLKLVRFF
ncbi:MAG: hypothetical protein ACI396_05500 [Acutalibacteraceae bacterium]